MFICCMFENMKILKDFSWMSEKCSWCSGIAEKTTVINCNNSILSWQSMWNTILATRSFQTGCWPAWDWEWHPGQRQLRWCHPVERWTNWGLQRHFLEDPWWPHDPKKKNNQKEEMPWGKMHNWRKIIRSNWNGNSQGQSWKSCKKHLDFLEKDRFTNFDLLFGLLQGSTG